MYKNYINTFSNQRPLFLYGIQYKNILCLEQKFITLTKICKIYKIKNNTYI